MEIGKLNQTAADSTTERTGVKTDTTLQHYIEEGVKMSLDQDDSGSRMGMMEGRWR